MPDLRLRVIWWMQVGYKDRSHRDTRLYADERITPSAKRSVMGGDTDKRDVRFTIGLIVVFDVNDVDRNARTVRTAFGVAVAARVGVIVARRRA
jgi:hypothetical protein